MKPAVEAFNTFVEPLRGGPVDDLLALGPFFLFHWSLPRGGPALQLVVLPLSLLPLLSLLSLLFPHYPHSGSRALLLVVHAETMYD